MNEDLSRYCYFVNSSGAVRIYHGNKTVMGAGVKAKTMTSLLIIPALLVKVFFKIMQDLS